jgi:hypothetical protein
MNNEHLSNFNYVNDTSCREMLLNAYQAIQLTETWDFMKNDIYSYMWDKNPEIRIISNKMSELGYNCHSGSSFGWTMREMQFIAQNGLEAHKESWLK